MTIIIFFINYSKLIFYCLHTCTILHYTGKTMQAVGFIECLRVKCNRPGPFIIVVPLSTIRHWQKELNERSGANTVVLHGTTEDRDTFVGSEFTGTRAAVYFIVFYSIVLYCIVLYCTVLYCTALYCTVLYRTVLYCTVLYCTVLW